MDALIQALADAHQDELIDLNALRVACLARISEGGGELGFVTDGTLNGKMARQLKSYDAGELLGFVNQALREVNDTAVSLTHCDFSGINGSC